MKSRRLELPLISNSNSSVFHFMQVEALKRESYCNYSV